MNALAIRTRRSVHARTPPNGVESALAETIASYETNAETYAKRYASLDMSEYISSFLDVRPRVSTPVLDAGCGAGRDCSRFAQRGVRAIGIDLSKKLVTIAAKQSGAQCVLGDLRALPFADQTFSGVWASASLVHLPRQEALTVVTRTLPEAPARRHPTPRTQTR